MNKRLLNYIINFLQFSGIFDFMSETKPFKSSNKPIHCEPTKSIMCAQQVPWYRFGKIGNTYRMHLNIYLALSLTIMVKLLNLIPQLTTDVMIVRPTVVGFTASRNVVSINTGLRCGSPSSIITIILRRLSSVVLSTLSTRGLSSTYFFIASQCCL